MKGDGTYTAVIDRFEGDLAVLEIEREDGTLDDLVVDRADLPDDAGPDAVLRITAEDGWIEEIEYDPDETRVRRDAAQDRFDRLADRPPDGDE